MNEADSNEVKRTNLVEYKLRELRRQKTACLYVIHLDGVQFTHSGVKLRAMAKEWDRAIREGAPNPRDCRLGLRLIRNWAAPHEASGR